MYRHFFNFASVLLICGLCLGCDSGSGLGKKIVVNGTEIYFDGEKVTAAEAETLGKFLQEQEFTDGTEKAVQLQRDGDTLVFKMVMQPEYLESAEVEPQLKLMCLQMSGAFEGQKTACHACDEQMVSKKKMVGLHGKRTDYGKGEIYYNNLSPEQFDAVKEVLNKLGFEEFEGTLYFGKLAGDYEFRMICTPEFQQDEELHRESKIWQEELSQAIGGEKVAVMLCDDYFDAKFTREGE